MIPDDEKRNALKKAAAEKAVDEVKDGMILGLGTGSTAAFAIEALGRKVAAGLNIQAIPTSEESARHAQACGISLTDFTVHPHIDLTIDGADQVERVTLNLVKGLGGALLREKIVASASKRMLVIVDEKKLVDRLGSETPLPVEILEFGYPNTLLHLEGAGLKPIMRKGAAEKDEFFRTDSGNFIADCHIAAIADPKALEAKIAVIPGVAASGLFVGMAWRVIVAGASGIAELRPRT